MSSIKILKYPVLICQRVVEASTTGSSCSAGNAKAAAERSNHTAVAGHANAECILSLPLSVEECTVSVCCMKVCTKLQRAPPQAVLSAGVQSFQAMSTEQSAICCLHVVVTLHEKIDKEHHCACCCHVLSAVCNAGMSFLAMLAA